MRLADVTIDVTLSNLALFAIVGALGGMLIGLLLKTTGLRVVSDLFFGALGSLAVVYFFGSLLQFAQYGFAAELLLAVAGGVAAVMLARFALLVRRRVKAAS